MHHEAGNLRLFNQESFVPWRSTHRKVRRSLAHFGNKALSAGQMAIGDRDLRNTSGHECRDRRLRCAASTEDQRMARGASTVEQAVERAAEACRVGIATNESAPSAGNCIDGTNLYGVVGEGVEERRNLLLVRHRYVRPHHQWIGTQLGYDAGKISRRNIHRLVFHWQADRIERRLLECGREAVLHRMAKQENASPAHAAAPIRARSS